MRAKLALVHAKWMSLELMRQPAYIVSTIAFPALFYVIFAVPESKTREAANFLMASFMGFAFFGVVFLQFGVGLAQERSRSWHQFLKTLPVPSLSLFTGRLLSALLFACMACLFIVLLSIGLTPMELILSQGINFLLTLFVGGLVFCVMGLALGYWSNEKTSLPLGNLIYLPMSFVGGLWKPPEILPEALKNISNYLPTRFYGNILWASVKGESLEARSILGLLFYLVLSASLAYWGYLRDSEKRMHG